MILIRKSAFISFSIFLLVLMMCFCRTFSYAENNDFLQDFEKWREYIAEKWTQFEKTDLDSEWFTIFKLPANVYAFYEMPYEQDVCSFLILGNEKAILWDTGMGLAPLRPLVEKLTDLPVIVLNSHDHFDHIGGNAEFDEVLCYDNDDVIRHLTNGPTEEEMEELAYELQKLSSVMDTSCITVPDHISGKVPTGTVKDGQIIDLGERTLEVFYTPGHNSSSIMLLDTDNKILFTGDMYYPGPLLAISEDSSFSDYVISMRKAADRAVAEKTEWLYCSHNYIEKGTDHLSQLADFLEGIQSGEITDYELVNNFLGYFMDDEISIFLPVQ